MASDALVFRSIANSDMPAPQKSQLMRAFEAVSGTSPTEAQMTRVKQHAVGLAEVVRSGGEAIGVGGILGAIDATIGLDIGKGKMKVPVDGLFALAGFGGAVLLAHEEIGTDMRNGGTVALGILTYRHTKRFVALKTGMAVDVAGESSMGNDPLDKIAERL